jgi:hypothetical protein
MWKRHICAVLAIGMLAMGASCGSRGQDSSMPLGKQSRSAFPTQDELERIAARPTTVKNIQGSSSSVNEWKLAGPVPDAVALAPHEDQTPWGRLLIDATGAVPGGVASAAMHCTARELGRFYLKQRTQPTQGLTRFIASRCCRS